MAIPRKETSLFPSDLLEVVPDNGVDQRWWVLHTKSRQEKSVAREMTRNRVPFFLPLLKRHSNAGRPRQISYIPLFTGYVFVFGSHHEREVCLRTSRLARILPVHDGDQLRRELHQINQLIEADRPLTFETRLEPGRRVRVTTGPFAGVEGVVLKRHGQSRLIVAVQLLQQGVSASVEEWVLEAID